MTYPDTFESFWIERAKQASGMSAEDTALHRMGNKVQALSDLFTCERPGKDFPDYFADRSLLAAYGVFFFPQSFAKAQWALDFAMRLRGWTPEGEAFLGSRASSPSLMKTTEKHKGETPSIPGNQTHNNPIRILDLGAGAGPCGLGLALALHAQYPNRKIHLSALDHSPHALAAFGDLAKTGDLPSWLSTDTLRHDLKSGVLPAMGGGFDLVVAGFALNEIFVARDHASRVDFVKNLRPLLGAHGLLILLEPAFKPTAEPLVAVSDALANGPEFFRFGPQLSPTPCPFLVDGANGKYWDHEVRLWAPPPAMEFVNRRLFRDIATLKFSCAILGASAPAPLPAVPEGGALLRLVSPMTPLKGRFVFAAVTAGGKRVTVQVPARGMSRKEEKEFEAQFERGDVVACQWKALKEEGLYSVEVDGLTVVHGAGA